MVEMIRNEIIECQNLISWDDISGLQFAKNTIQVHIFSNSILFVQTFLFLLYIIYFELLGVCHLASFKT